MIYDLQSKLVAFSCSIDWLAEARPPRCVIVLENSHRPSVHGDKNHCISVNSRYCHAWFPGKGRVNLNMVTLEPAKKPAGDR